MAPVTKARGYVLFIVLIVGLAASLAAAALINASGGARVNAMHTENDNIAAAIAEAGMNHALAYVEGATSTSADFDAILDVGLDSNCTSFLSTPGSWDPETSTGPEDLIPAIAGGDTVTVNGKRYTRVSDYNGGAYFIRFDDDDDDSIATNMWMDNTGNNEVSEAGVALNCFEGRRAGDSSTGNHAGGVENRLRDRNRTIWVTVMGIYPGNDPDTATHHSVMRSLHTGPRPPSLTGIQVRGDFVAGGNSSFLACSPIAGVEVDGDASATGNATACASGLSNADSWTGDWERCAETSHCEDLVPDPWGIGLTAAPGRLDTPGPDLAPIPDVWNRADEWVDWSRPCVFWVDNAAGPGTYNGSVWFWDAQRTVGGDACADFEGRGLPFPGPPDPSRAASSHPTAKWTGCWTPLILDAHGGWGLQTPESALVAATFSTLPSTAHQDNVRITATCGGASCTYGVAAGSDGIPDNSCFATPWKDPASVSAFYEHKRQPSGTNPSDDPCRWYPKARVGQYRTCDETHDNTFIIPGDCGIMGATPRVGTTVVIADPIVPFGPLNAKLQQLGMPRFPHNIWLNKPDWSQACRVRYPPPFVAGTSANFHCDDTSGCHRRNGEDGATDPQNPVLTFVNSAGLFLPKFDDLGDVQAAPAGVYYYPGGMSVTGGALSWGAPRPWASGADPDPASGSPAMRLAEYPLMTIMSREPITFNANDMFFGIGQSVASPGTEGNPDRWGRWPTWITGAPLALQGNGSSTFAGSLYTTSNINFGGNTTYYAYGELHVGANANVGGNSSFYWLYKTPLIQRNSRGYGGTLPTVLRSAH